MTTKKINKETAFSKASEIVMKASKELQLTGLEVSFIFRKPHGSNWPVLMLEVGECYSDINTVRNGNRQSV